MIDFEECDVLFICVYFVNDNIYWDYNNKYKIISITLSV